MAEILDVPEAVVAFIVRAFSHVNDVVSAKISKTPNTPEESLDIAFIEALSHFAGPTRITNDFAVRIAAHFIGSLRHYRRYEIADIGLVIVFKKGASVCGRKLILLQSKRLYPLNHVVEELDDFDYGLGLALITRSERTEAPIFAQVTYKFTDQSVYGAMMPDSEQCRAIADHFGETSIPVHYLFYNPVIIPWEISYPLSDGEALPKRDFGARVLESDAVTHAMAKTGRASSPSLEEISSGGSHPFGRSLEVFMDDAVRCREGYRFSHDRDEGIRRLFSRKSGPIFCVIEITIESSQEG